MDDRGFSGPILAVAVKVTLNKPPREFRVGKNKATTLLDCGRIRLEPGELVTFTTPFGAEFDFCRKEWGFYATPSLNGRLSSFGLRALLAKGPDGKYYILVVESGQETVLERYMEAEGHTLVAWLDSSSSLAELEAKIKS